MTSSSAKSTSSLLVATALTVAVVAISLIITDLTNRLRRGDGKNMKREKKKSESEFHDGSQEALVNERFQACAKAMASQLSRLPQQTQLDYYGLYKQGMLGNCSEYHSGPPSATDLVTGAKYRAWSRFQGMDRMTAMQNYIDKAVHYQFVNSIAEGQDDENYELEGDAVIDVVGLGDKPSTLLSTEYDDKEELALDDSQHPLHAAAREGALEKLITMLLSSSSSSDETNTADLSPNALDDSGQTPLHLAADRGHLDCMKALILEGADINAADHDGISVLQAGVISGDTECCRLLLILGANLDLRDNDGDSPRDSAQDDEEMKELLEQYDNNILSTEDLLDPDFVQELHSRNIPVPTPNNKPGEEHNAMP